MATDETTARVSGTGNRCTLHGDDGSTTDYWALQGGGYVHRDVYVPGEPPRTGCLGPQVCTGLGSTGATLRWSGRGDLAALIRREWRSTMAIRRVSDDPTDAEWAQHEAEQRAMGIR